MKTAVDRWSLVVGSLRSELCNPVALHRARPRWPGYTLHCLVATALLITFAVGDLRATTVRPMDVETMARRAEAVVEGRALEQWSQWDAQHRLIYTYTRFEVRRALKGAPAETVVVRQMGGSAQGYTQKVSGVRTWKAGEESVLFLRRSEAADGSMAVVGLMQGNFRIVREAGGALSVSNGVPEVRTLDSTGRETAFHGVRMSLDELEQRVRKAVGQ